MEKYDLAKIEIQLRNAVVLFEKAVKNKAGAILLTQQKDAIKYLEKLRDSLKKYPDDSHGYTYKIESGTFSHQFQYNDGKCYHREGEVFKLPSDPEVTVVYIDHECKIVNCSGSIYD